MAITTWAATTGDWDDSKFSRPWDGPNIAPAVGSVTLSTTAPGGGISYFISVGNTSLEMIQSYEWDQMGAADWNDTTYSWDTGPSPNINIGTSITPDNADLTVTASAPAQGVIYTFSIDNGDLTLTGKIPEVADGTIISPDKGDLEVLNSHTWNNYGGTWATAYTNWNDDSFAPDAVETGKNEPAAAELTLTAYAPAQGIRYTFDVGKADLTLTGYAPAGAGISHFRSPDNADLTGLKGPAGAWNDSSETWAAISGTWQTGELVPTAGVTYIFPIDEGDVTLSGYSPVKVKKDPTYLATIIAT